MYIVLICTYCTRTIRRRVYEREKNKEMRGEERRRGKNEENFTFVRKSLNRRLDEKVNNDDNGDEREIVLF